MPLVNWIEVVAVQRPQIWRDECMAVGFIQLLCLAALQTLQTKIMAYDNHYRGLGETFISHYLMYGQPFGRMSAPPLQPNFLHCVCTLAYKCHSVGRYLLFLTATQ